jgi:cysteine desulfurase/selenocysteine lyase
LNERSVQYIAEEHVEGAVSGHLNTESDKPSMAAPIASFDPEAFRAQFPILERRLDGGKALVYLDNAASSQKPQLVLDAIQHYYRHSNSNIHRGAHRLATEATDAYEAARATAARFLNAPDARCINFTKGTTEGINLVASGLAAGGEQGLQPGDEVLVSVMEHHANIVPWQMACARSGASLKVLPLGEAPDASDPLKPAAASIDLEAARACFNERTKVLALVMTSNSLGTVNPVQALIAMARQVGAQVLLDAAQASVHEAIDVQALDVDYLVFGMHKVYGPTGIGILYGKEARLEALPPYQGGGEMIREVRFEGTTYNDLPYKFEAGTPNIAGGVATGVALDFLMQQDRAGMQAHENALLERIEGHLDRIGGIRRFSVAERRTSLASFLPEGVHAFDLGVLLDKQGIAVRTGHHCCQPLMQHFGIEGTVRASMLPYNTLEEMDAFGEAMEKALLMLR